MTAQPAGPAPVPDTGSYEVIHLGGQAAVVVPVADRAYEHRVTTPLATLLGLGENPGEAAGFGPVDADLARAMAATAAGHPATTWCLTVTDPTATPSPTDAPTPPAAPGPGANRTGPAGPIAGNGAAQQARHARHQPAR